MYGQIEPIPQNEKEVLFWCCLGCVELPKEDIKPAPGYNNEYLAKKIERFKYLYANSVPHRNVFGMYNPSEPDLITYDTIDSRNEI
jgi:hypothetical protein